MLLLSFWSKGKIIPLLVLVMEEGTRREGTKIANLQNNCIQLGNVESFKRQMTRPAFSRHSAIADRGEVIVAVRVSTCKLWFCVLDFVLFIQRYVKVLFNIKCQKIMSL